MMNNDEGTLQYLALMWLKMVNKKEQPGPKRASKLNKQSMWLITASLLFTLVHQENLLLSFFVLPFNMKMASSSDKPAAALANLFSRN